MSQILFPPILFEILQKMKHFTITLNCSFNNSVQDVVQAVSNVEMHHSAPEDMTGIMQRYPDIWCDVSDFLEVQGDGVLHDFFNLVAGVDGFLSFMARNLYCIKLQQRHDISRRSSTIDRTSIPELEEIGNKS